MHARLLAGDDGPQQQAEAVDVHGLKDAHLIAMMDKVACWLHKARILEQRIKVYQGDRAPGMGVLFMLITHELGCHVAQRAPLHMQGA